MSDSNELGERFEPRLHPLAFGTRRSSVHRPLCQPSQADMKQMPAASSVQRRKKNRAGLFLTFNRERKMVYLWLILTAGSRCSVVGELPHPPLCTIRRGGQFAKCHAPLSSLASCREKGRRSRTGKEKKHRAGSVDKTCFPHAAANENMLVFC